MHDISKMFAVHRMTFSVGDCFGKYHRPIIAIFRRREFFSLEYGVDTAVLYNSFSAKYRPIGPYKPIGRLSTQNYRHKAMLAIVNSQRRTRLNSTVALSHVAQCELPVSLHRRWSPCLEY